MTTQSLSIPDLSGLLPDWLPNQRWFGGKGRPVARYRVASAEEMSRDEPTVVVAIVEVTYEPGAGVTPTPEYYQLVLSLRASRSDRLDHVLIGQLGSLWCYDAAHDRDAMSAVLGRLVEGRPSGGLTFGRFDDTTIDASQPNRPMNAEQSNTSVVFGDSYILKVFRRVAPGVNPELEITSALAAAECTSIVPPLGWIEGEVAGERATLALLQPFLRSATDGWAMAATSVRDLYAEADLHADEVGGDFAAESVRLGAATAAVHVRLAEALPTRPASAEDLARMQAAMRAKLDDAVHVVPELGPYAEPVRAAYADIGNRAEPLTLQRVHGDYHLGQVIRTDTGWLLLDFEGEPARPLAERRALDTPLRDIAGMLRSFDYSARHLLADHADEPQLQYRAQEWAERNRAAFCRGYQRAGGIDPSAEQPLLRALELDKAVYEVVYEARNRPTWVHIPLGAIERLVS